VILSVIMLAMAVITFVALVRFSIGSEWENLLMVTLIGVVALLSVVFWAFFLKSASLQGPYVYVISYLGIDPAWYATEVALFWVDKVIILLGTYVHGLLVYQLGIVFVSESWRKFVTAGFLALALILIGVLLGLGIPYSRAGEQGFLSLSGMSIDNALLISLLSIFFGIQLVLAGAVLVLEVMLLREHFRSSSSSRWVAIRLLLFSVPLLITSLARIIVVFHTYAVFWQELGSIVFLDLGGAASWFTLVGLQNIEFKTVFSGYVFYVFGFLLPDVVPFVVVLAVVWLSRRNAQREREERNLVPLLEQTSIPERYKM
jgi:hypothetical protein